MKSLYLNFLGIGNVLFQISAQTGCQSHGIEIRKELFDISLRMKESYDIKNESHRFGNVNILMVFYFSF